jgi:hypothetical protein
MKNMADESIEDLAKTAEIASITVGIWSTRLNA